MTRLLIGEAVTTDEGQDGIFAGYDYGDDRYCYVHTNSKALKVEVKSCTRKINCSKATIILNANMLVSEQPIGDKILINLDCKESYERGHMHVMTIAAGSKKVEIYMDQDGNINISKINESNIRRIGE